MTYRIMLVCFLVTLGMSVALSFGCAGGNSKLKSEDCTNRIDDDGDGRIDCLDSDCVLHVACLASTEDCTNRIDDDNDGHIDCLDADCAASPACQTNAENCGNGLDDDNDTLVDCADPDCASFAACQTNAENCGNGLDDDNDTLVDCADPDCASFAACHGGTCSINDIFFDSLQTCQTGFICGIDNQLQPTCLPSSTFAGGTTYGACGPNGECPKGSGCFSDGTSSACYPFCTDAHLGCPPGGICAYGIEGSDTLYLCAPYDDCDVVGGSAGCNTGEGCYLVSEQGDGFCITNGTGATGTPCTSTLDCQAGNICADPGNGNVCIKLCDNSHPCPAGTGTTCYTDVGLPAGIGACR